MKTLHPSMMELDSFRWGNLDYSNEDRWVLAYRSEELKQINSGFNRQALDLALEIVEKQMASAESIQPLALADGKIIRSAEILNEQTIREINDLRKQMDELAVEPEKKMIPLEIERPGT